MTEAVSFRARGALVVASFLFALCFAGSAHAERTLVMPLAGSVPDAPDGIERLTQVVARGAGLTGDEVVRGQATFADATALMGCSEETPECFARLAESLGVDEVVTGTVRTEADGSVVVELVMFGGGEIQRASLALAGGGIDALVASLARQVPEFFVPGGAPPEPAAPPEPEPEPEPEPAPAAAITAPAPPPADDRRSEGGVGLLPWVVGASGLVLGGAGVGFWVIGGQNQDEVDSAVIRSADDFERLVELEDRGERNMLIGNGLVIAGGALVATGLVIAVVQGVSGDDAGEGGEPGAVSVGPALLSNGFGLSLSVSAP